MFQQCFFKQGQAENLKNCVEIGLEVESFLEDGDKHIDRDGDPDLGLDGILGGAEEGFDAQVLLDPLEKEFHLPSVAVEIGHRLCGHDEIVGQKIEGFAGLGMVVFDAP